MSGRPLLPALLALALGAAGCAHPLLASWAVRECPGALRPTDEIEDGLRLRQQVRVSSGDGFESSLQLVAEKQRGRLVLLGLNAFGGKLFSVIQRGVETEVQGLPPPAAEVPPLNFLFDLHRVHFLTVGAPAGGSGEVSAVVAGVRVSEHWEGGELSWRRFGPGDDDDVRVTFAGGRARVSHAACGYTSSIVSLGEPTR